MLALGAAAEIRPAPQQFLQEIAVASECPAGWPKGRVQLLDAAPGQPVRAFAAGRWHSLEGEGSVVASLTPGSADEFCLAAAEGGRLRLAVPWKEVVHVLRRGSRIWVATPSAVWASAESGFVALGGIGRVHQIAVGSEDSVHLASSQGLFRRVGGEWQPVEVTDDLGRAWGRCEALGIAFDTEDRLWLATRGGVGCRSKGRWHFYEGKDGLPWNDFTGLAAGTEGDVWFGTRLGAIRYDGKEWHYRQGRRWLPHDEVLQVAVEGGTAWFATAAGVGRIERRPMTLAEKAAYYEDEIARHIRRTPLGYVAEAPLRRAGDRSTADPQDSDNDGLWTAMYGAGECFAYAATKDEKAKARARQAFEALRFLQKVTQGGSHAPPKGFVARTIRSTDGPDPNDGRLEADRREQRRDALWKVYEPRWPKSADGRWYWKSDTSSDELDGHFFFYPLYHDFCADTDAERDRVREVVRDLADHLLAHDYCLVDHDGRPTRWGVFGPRQLNHDPNWWPERGLNSLSLLSYLAAAGHVTGDPKYAAASRDLVDRHGYAQNAMYPKVQHGPGSGNQSDDEMAFMCFYGLLRNSTDEALKARMRYAFFRYWANEAPELNPFFNFAYAAHNLEAQVENPWGAFPLRPWGAWQEESMAALRGFSLDRLDWAHRNSHRLDLRLLPLVGSVDLYEARRGGRGCRADGRVLPVENRHFNHWNTDPWRLDYGGTGGELASGTVFLLPYYLGLYHGFIERP